MKKILCIILTTALFGCAQGGMQKQDIGALTGGALGGVLGNQIGHGNARVAATIVGTLAGAMIGGSIGRSMDDVDRMKMNQALEMGQSNRTSTWVNPDTHASYQVTPTNTYYDNYAGDSRPCRKYRMRAVIDGRTQNIYGTACRMEDGRWQNVAQ